MEHLRRLLVHAGVLPAAGRPALTGDLPAAVLADLFGLHINSAGRWTHHARRDWAAYLASRSAT